jgi:hypothetical protein
MTEQPKQQAGRLAMRAEGDWWVAYYALPATMTGAVEIGRIAMAAVQRKKSKDAFLDICKTFVVDVIRDRTGAKAELWTTRPAPEHERSGRA